MILIIIDNVVINGKSWGSTKLMGKSYSGFIQNTTFQLKNETY